MKSKKMLAAVMAATVLTASLFAGCGSKTPQAGTDNQAASGEMDKEQYLNLTLKAEPKTMDLSKATDLYSSQILIEITEGLTRLEKDKDGKEIIAPAGAKEWKTSEDGLKWTFTLRDYEWYDGKKVTANDYVYSILRTLDPNTAAQYAYFLFPIKGAEEYNSGKGKKEDVGVKAIDDNTLEFTLKQPVPYFLQLTSFKTFLPQRQDIVEKYGDKYGTEAETLPVNGPFKIASWTHQSDVVLEKNEKYWDKDNVKLDKVNFKIIKDETARMNELENGSIDAVGVRKPEYVDQFNKAGKYTNLTGYDGSVVYQTYNTIPKIDGQVNPFNSPKVRLAFSLALNREDIVKTIYKGLGSPALGWVPFEILIGDQEYRKAAGVEPLKAAYDKYKDPKALLVEGLKELGLPEDPSKITIKMINSGTDAETKEIAEYYQQAYQNALGVKIEPEYMEWNQFMKRLDSGEYQLAGLAWGADYNDPMTFMDMWLSNAGQMNNGWKNAKYDELINKTRTAKDDAERTELFKQAEQLLLVDEAVASPVNYRKYNIFEANYVKNLMLVNFGQLYEVKYAYTQGRGK
ncbi:oligopeptide transport system substrate-binding protein [Clostridium sp. USBA 49]|jgi:oligopeptide transport system substrate-binding protein|uniref:peptide ABC transporter substrate-binding protein n=1 Tax=Clostridium TaxID=1485 RepID=UPI0009999485|nr:MULTISPECIES: peptide ABC transporter substrate-binding protein [Clostridium]SKA83734.1 oligopeptide transport system substrate-binding protein [Clostridium sp. USBA 49]